MRTKTRKKNKINVITLGCSKNVYDSEVLMGQLKANNKDVVHEEEGNVVVINTCGFIDNAKEQSVNTILDAVKLFMNDEQTDGIVMIGEIGGQLEADAAKWVQKNGTKPVVGFIAGQTAPKGRTMGHAGAIVGGKDDTAEAKMRILSQCGVHVVESPARIGAKIAELIGVSV